jgi:hypothetical protein
MKIIRYFKLHYQQTIKNYEDKIHKGRFSFYCVNYIFDKYAGSNL